MPPKNGGIPVTLTETTWIGYEDGERIGACEGFQDYPAGAALRICCEKWAGGKHRITVANNAEVRIFEIDLSIKEVTDAV